MNAPRLRLRLEPTAQNPWTGLQLHTTVYSPDIDLEMPDGSYESVGLSVQLSPFHTQVSLSPDEARVLANQLLQCADQADENRERRESFEQISEEMREAAELGSDGTGFYAHPDVHYVPADQMQAKLTELKGRKRFIVLPRPVLEGAEA